MSTEDAPLKVEDFHPKTSADPMVFAVVRRERLLEILDSILERKGDSDWTRDAARKVHFGLVHGLGTVEDFVESIREDERAECAKRLREVANLHEGHDGKRAVEVAAGMLVDVKPEKGTHGS